MAKINVQIDEIRHLSQFRSLLPRYTHGDNEYCIFKHENVNDNGIILASEHIAPYDLAIRHKFNIGTPAVITDELRNILYLTRYTKDRQALMMKEVLGESKNYMHLDASTVDLTNPASPVFSFPPNPFDKPGDERYVIRHNTGARGLGLMITPKLSEFNSRMFFRDLVDLRKKKEPAATNEDYQKLCNEYSVELKLGVEKTPNEAASILATGSLVITPYNSKPFKEYRVITSFGGELLIVERDHKADRKAYAKVCNDLVKRMIFHNLSIDLTRLQPHGSFDLWISDTGSEWGLFEFQPQYGHEDIPDDVHVPFMKEVISNMVKSTLKVEKPVES